MAEKRTRRSFTREFKAQAVKRLLEGGKGLSEVATELGLSTGQLSTWRSEQLAAGSAEALAQRKAEEAETQRLRREVKRLEEEGDAIYADAIRELFLGEPEPMDVLKRKELYDVLEEAIDLSKDVAEVLTSIAVKRT